MRIEDKNNEYEVEGEILNKEYEVEDEILNEEYEVEGEILNEEEAEAVNGLKSLLKARMDFLNMFGGKIKFQPTQEIINGIEIPHPSATIDLNEKNPKIKINRPETTKNKF